jgi:membrane-associated phospholipid phosphatase
MSIDPAPARRHSDGEVGRSTFGTRDARPHPAPRRSEWIHHFAREWIAVVLVGTAALIGFAIVGQNVFAHESSSFDGAVQAWMLAHHDPRLDTSFLWVTRIGGIMGMRVLALVGAVYLWFRGHRRVAAGVLVVPVVADMLFHVMKRIYARPRPLGLGGRVDSSYSFPSGHATMSAAVCCTLAYVLWREGFVGRWTALAFALLVPLLVGASRFYLNVHWATDVLGGWCVGLFVAVLSAALYNHHRRRRAIDRRVTVHDEHAKGITP